MAPSHVDLSVLWVPIMPETSKLGEQMEEVGKEATESFGKGSTGLGDKIHESVSKSRDKIKDVFHRTGSDAGKSMSDAFKEESKAVEDTAGDVGKKAEGKFRESTKGWGKVLVEAVGPETKKLLGDRLEDVVGSSLEGVLGDNSKWAGKMAHTVADSAFDALKNKIGGVKDAADKTRQAFADFGKGDTVSGVSQLVDGMGKLGIETKDLPQPLQDAVSKLNEAKSTAQGFADIFNGLPGKIGAVGKAIEGLAGPLAVALQASKDIDEQMRQSGIDPNAKGDDAKKQFEDGFKRIHRDGSGNIVVDPKAPKPSGVDMSGVGGIGKGGDVLGSGQDAYDAFSSGKPLASSSGDSVPLKQNPDGTWTSSNPAWAHLIQRESGGNPSVFNNYDSNAAAGDPSQGLFQFTRATWAAHGGLKYGRDPSKATPQQQAEIAANLIKANPSGSDWGAGMSGRESASGLLSGVGANGAVSTGWWDTSGGGHGGGSASTPMPSMPRQAGGTTASGDKIPTGAQHDPLYVSAAGSAGGAGGDAAAGGDSSPLAQQLGSGLLGGIAQSVGLDGSVFKTFSGASNPMDFGITKLGTGLMNWAGGMLPAMQGQHAQKQQPTSPTYNVDQSFNLTQHGVQGDGSDGFKAGMNSSNRTEALASGLPG